MSRSFLLINCIIGLIIGVTFYLLFDNTTIVTKEVYELLGVNKPVIEIDNDIIQFVRVYILDLFWAYSMWFGIAFCSYCFEHKIIITSFITVLCGIIVEVLQRIGIFKGTADFLDVVFEVIGVLLAAIVYQICLRMKKENS